MIRIYVFDNSPESVRALQEIRSAVSTRGNVPIEVIDVSKNALEAIASGVFVTPMTIIANHGIIGVPKGDEVLQLLESCKN